ncbi:MAG: apolipoprotein N-acyltransferase, partial [Zoogloeaceae bacterium]|nr:apolipoprotein N-acyltransferase [Zoogloeaceae bacterium]
MRWWPSLGAFVSGAATVLGFAPFEWSLLPIFTLAALFVFWRRADSPRQAALLGFLWGMGCFLVGASWVYVSMHDVGGMAMPLAGLATSLFCAYLALFPACAGWLYRRFATGDSRDVLLLAGVWTLTEWLRGWLFTGFPWLAIGYSQTSGPLAGFAPLVGVYGVGLLLAGISAWLACQSRWFLVLLPVVISVLIAVEQGLHSIKWSQPIGEPITVSLLQGNIPQSLKWEPEKLPLSMETYARLATKHPAQLIVLPETAIPLLFDRIPPDFLQKLTARGPVLIGSAMRVPEGGYTNSAIALTPDLPAQTYAKGHLVP